MGRFAIITNQRADRGYQAWPRIGPPEHGTRPSGQKPTTARSFTTVGSAATQPFTSSGSHGRVIRGLTSTQWRGLAYPALGSSADSIFLQALRVRRQALLEGGRENSPTGSQGRSRAGRLGTPVSSVDRSLRAGGRAQDATDFSVSSNARWAGR